MEEFYGQDMKEAFWTAVENYLSTTRDTLEVNGDHSILYACTVTDCPFIWYDTTFSE